MFHHDTSVNPAQETQRLEHTDSAATSQTGSLTYKDRCETAAQRTRKFQLQKKSKTKIVLSVGRQTKPKRLSARVPKRDRAAWQLPLTPIS